MAQIDLNSHDLNVVCEILKNYASEYTVWAFGSRVKGNAKKYSDLDLVIMTSQPLSFSKMAIIKEAFDESDLPIRVDVVDWAETTETFQKIIEHNKVIIQEGEKMPEISRFLGIVIYMYFNEHNPPHFHAEYNEFKVAILIETLGIMEGKMPSKVLSLVIEWAQEHQQELLDDWKSIKATGQYHKIQPLV